MNQYHTFSVKITKVMLRRGFLDSRSQQLAESPVSIIASVARTDMEHTLTYTIDLPALASMIDMESWLGAIDPDRLRKFLEEQREENA